MIGLPAALSLLIALTSPITARSIRNRHNPQSESQACTTNAECLQLGLPLKAPRYLSGRATNPIANVTFTCGQNADFKVDASFSGIYNYIVVGGSGGDATAAGTTGGHAAEVRGQVKIDRETLFIRPGCQGVSGQGGGGGGGASYTMYRTSFTAGNGHGIATAGGGGGAGTSASGVDASLEEYGTLDSAGTPFNERGQGLSNTGTGDYGGGGADEALPGGGEQGLNNGAGGESLSQDTDAIGTIGAGGLAAQSQISPQGTGGYGGGGGAGLTTGKCLSCL